MSQCLNRLLLFPMSTVPKAHIVWNINAFSSYTMVVIPSSGPLLGAVSPKKSLQEPSPWGVCREPHTHNYAKNSSIAPHPIKAVNGEKNK